METTESEEPGEGVEMVTDEERRTSYLELFFDLVVVFAITQVAALILSDTSAAGFARSTLVLGLVWWAWSGFAWMTNAIDIDDRVTKLSMLLAMAATFMLAFAIPGAYAGDGAWLGSAFLAIGVLNVWLYLRGSRHDRELQRSVARLAPFFLGGPVLVFGGGLVDGHARDVLWVVAILVNLAGALDAGGRVWRVSASHFAERHALFVIIALGESIVAIGAGAIDGERRLALAVAMLVAFAGTAGLWWAYFGFVAGAVERALHRHDDPRTRGLLARNVFTFAHFPIILGIVFFAVAAKKVVAHPDEPLSDAGRLALGVGLALMLGGLTLGRWFVVRTIAAKRLLAGALVLAAAWFLDDLDATVVLAIAVAILMLEIAWEHWRYAAVAGG
ncbi:MAG: low temperature requirement protein A [Gaiella sp.]